MKLIGPLMSEHRLIERFVAVLDRETREAGAAKKWASANLPATVDFFRVYADRTHHGKEEDILFRKLGDKPIVPELRRTLTELVAQHNSARKNVTLLAEARSALAQGGQVSWEELTHSIRFLVAFYPAHIIQEERDLFYPALEYFSTPEQDAMLAEFAEFDRKLIHERYEKTVEELEEGTA